MSRLRNPKGQMSCSAAASREAGEKCSRCGVAGNPHLSLNGYMLAAAKSTTSTTMTTTTTSTTTHTKFLALSEALSGIEEKLENQIIAFADVQAKQDARIKALEADNKAKAAEISQLKMDNLASAKSTATTTGALRVRQDQVVEAIRRAFAAAPDAAPARATTQKPSSSGSNEVRNQSMCACVCVLYCMCTA